MKTKVRKLVDFLKTDIWRIRLHGLSRSKSFLIRHLRIILLAVRGFRGDKCSLRASALTFYSILSIVPVAAMAFGVAKGFGLERIMEERLREGLKGQEEVVERIIGFSQNLLENARGGLVAGVGIAILLWAVIRVLGNIEKSFNDIWGIKKGRTLGRKFTDYVSIVLICPILLVMSGAVTVVLKTQIDAIFQAVAFLGFLGPLVYGLVKVIPYVVGCTVFAFIYVFMPNTKVKIKSGIVAGVVAGMALQSVQWLYISFQIGVTKSSAVYVSFAALPLFLVWLQVSWLIVLFGAELSFAHQNVETYEFEPDCLSVSYSFKRLLSVKVTHLLVQNFAVGKKPATAAEISHELGVPIRLVNDVLYELVDASILSVTKEGDGGEAGYQPARAIETLSVGYVVEALDRRGTDNIPITSSEELEKLSNCLKEFSDARKKSPANMLLKDI